jgi:hypothetical protein
MNCRRCGGAKKVMGFGLMDQICEACNGTGRDKSALKSKVAEKVEVAEVEAPKAAPKKRASTRKKVVGGE